MPTGYTADVVDGKVTDFRTFALRCARAFGACIDMRDDPMDREPPETVEPSRYCENAAQRARERLVFLDSLTEADIAKHAAKAHEDALESWRSACDRYGTENARLKAMERKVLAWKPPTAEHVGMRDFMLEQLRISQNDWMPEKPQPETPEEWFKREQEEARRSLERNVAEQKKDDERAASRTKWLKDLRESLAKHAGGAK